MSKFMPEKGEMWRSKNIPDAEVRVLAVVRDDQGQVDPRVVYVSSGELTAVVSAVRLSEFLEAKEPVPLFKEGDVIEYPSGLRYYVAESGKMHRIAAIETPVSNWVVAKKIN